MILKTFSDSIYNNGGIPSISSTNELPSYHASPPTWMGSKEEFTVQTSSSSAVKMASIDLGGHKQARRVWKEYFHSIDAVFFVMDASDKCPKRIAEAREELHGILNDPVIVDADIPVAVLGNKIDISGAMGESDLIHTLGVFHLRTGKNKQEMIEGDSRKPFEVFMCSLLKRQGYGEAFKWMAQHLK